MSDPLDLAALAREIINDAYYSQRSLYETEAFLLAKLELVRSQSHTAGRADGLEEARAAFAELDAASAAPFEAGKDNFSPFRRAWDRLARALASSDPAPRDQVAEDGTVPERETAWLIERLVSPPQYVASRDVLSSLTMDPWRAARFKTEREAFDARLRIIGDDLRDECRAVEHVFINKPVSAPTPPVEPGEVERLRSALTNARRAMIVSVTGISDGLTIHDIRDWLADADRALGTSASAR